MGLLAQVAGTSFLPQLLNWVDKENLPDYMGGTSTATLIDDAGPWQDAAIVAEVSLPSTAAVQLHTLCCGPEQCHSPSA